jgi:hypothetical protein
MADRNNSSTYPKYCGSLKTGQKASPSLVVLSKFVYSMNAGTGGSVTLTGQTYSVGEEHLYSYG